MIIYYNQEEELNDLCSRIKNEPKINIKTDWLSKVGDLKSLVQNYRRIIVLNGSVLYDKTEINNALTSITGNSLQSDQMKVSDMDSERLDFLLNNIGDFNKKGLEISANKSAEKKDGSDADIYRKIGYLPDRQETIINDENDFKIQHDRIIQSGGLDTDSLINRLFSRSVSRLLTHLAIRTSISPNQITLVSFFLGLVSIWFFFQGSYGMSLIGAVVLVISTWIDGVDGELARLTFGETPFGAKLDITCDCLVNFAVFFSIGAGLSQSTGEGYFTALGTLAVLGSLVSFIFLSASISESKSPERSEGISKNRRRNIENKLANRDFIFILLVLALINRTDIFIWLAAIGANIFAVYSFYARFLAR